MLFPHFFFFSLTVFPFRDIFPLGLPTSVILGYTANLRALWLYVCTTKIFPDYALLYFSLCTSMLWSISRTFKHNIPNTTPFSVVHRTRASRARVTHPGGEKMYFFKKVDSLQPIKDETIKYERIKIKYVCTSYLSGSAWAVAVYRYAFTGPSMKVTEPRTNNSQRWLAPDGNQWLVKPSITSQWEFTPEERTKSCCTLTLLYVVDIAVRCYFRGEKTPALVNLPKNLLSAHLSARSPRGSWSGDP